jgi:hypothetical protein
MFAPTTARAGRLTCGVPVDGYVPDLTLSAKAGWARFIRSELNSAGLTDGMAVSAEASWN